MTSNLLKDLEKNLPPKVPPKEGSLLSLPYLCSKFYLECDEVKDSDKWSAKNSFAAIVSNLEDRGHPLSFLLMNYSLIFRSLMFKRASLSKYLVFDLFFVFTHLKYFMSALDTLKVNKDFIDFISLRRILEEKEEEYDNATMEKFKGIK